MQIDLMPIITTVVGVLLTVYLKSLLGDFKKEVDKLQKMITEHEIMKLQVNFLEKRMEKLEKDLESIKNV